MDRIKELEVERNNLMSAIDQKDAFINKIKAWLEDEVKCQGKHPWDNGDEMVDDDGGDICVGRSECAEGLLNQIEKWENE